jgi:sterol desaturase/sphingolipid hydroxylase (fatty acid hydroxylase superfamily)
MDDIVRLTAFFGIFAILAVAEVIAPRRKLSVSKRWRWFNNLALTGLDVITVRVIFGAAVIKTAIFAQENGWGVLNYLQAPYLLRFLVTIVFLDFMIYIQHVLSHALPIFWRLHMVHHTDLDFDVTTAARFHPLEIIISLVYKLALIVVTGAEPVAVLAFEIILNGAAQFNHSNLNIPAGLDSVLRRFIITPDFHRVHHSVKIVETNSNYGFFVPYWDYLRGTYRAQPALSHTEMIIGLKEYRDKRKLSLPALVILPFIVRTEKHVRRD